MPSKLDLQDLEQFRDGSPSKKQVKEALSALLSNDTVEKERLELLENILKRSNVQFASVADKVTVEFSKFVKLVLTHDLEPLLQEEARMREQGLSSEKSHLVVASDLLTDISNCDKIDDDPLESMNVLSGIYVFGILSGFILSLGIALLLQVIEFNVSTRDLLFVLLGSIALIFVPLFFIMAEPFLKGVQRRHNEIFQRLLGFFNGRR